MDEVGALMEKIKKVLSFGGGVQTGALLAMVLHDDFERPDVVIFADPGWETKATYAFIDFCKEKCAKAGLPFVVGSKGNIRSDSLIPNRFVPLPFHMSRVDGAASGLGRRQCTREYKIDIVNKTTREFFEIPKGSHIKPPIECWVGISLDEVKRMKESRVVSFVNRWPLIEMRKTRRDCLEYFKKVNWPMAPKSACIGCPYHNNTYWRELKKSSPEEFEDACQFDDAIRLKETTEKGSELTHLPYIHSSRVPLRDANLGEDQHELWTNECEGHCGL